MKLKNILKSSLRKILPIENYLIIRNYFNGAYNFEKDLTFDLFLKKSIPNAVHLPLRINYPFCDDRSYSNQYELGDLNNRLGHEPELTNLLSNLLPMNGVFFDIGANKGYCTLYVAHMPTFRGEIHTFEPLTHMFNAMNEIINNNTFNCNISLHNTALSSMSGQATIGWNDDAGLASLHHDQVKNSEIVQVNSVDEMPLPRPDFMKIDTEGHEYETIKGALNTIDQYKPLIFLESTITNRLDESALRPLWLLESLDYKFFLPAWLQDDAVVHVGIGPSFSFDNPILIPFNSHDRLLFPGEAINIFAAPSSYKFDN